MEELDPLSAPAPEAGHSESHFTAVAVCLFLLLSVGLVFGRTVNYQFVDYDDNDYVYKNRYICDGVSVAGIKWVLTHGHVGNWHPLTSFSHMLDCSIYGMNAGGHHFTNVALHAATAITLFWVLLRTTGRLWPSALAATIFAIHPLRAESVAWVSERKDVLSGLFFMLTLAAYLGYVRRPSSMRRYLLVFVPYCLGLISKPMLVTLPVVLLLLDYWPLGRFHRLREIQNSGENRRGRIGRGVLLIREKIPFFQLAMALGIATLATQRVVVQSVDRLAIWPRIGNAIVSYVGYCVDFLWPFGLTAFYPHPQNMLATWKIVGAALVLTGISWGVVALRRRMPYLVAGWLWYVIMLVPVIGLLQVGDQARADRYTYLPQVGIAIAIAWGFADLSRRSRWARRSSCILIVVLIGFFMVRASAQVSYWRDTETLWTHALDCNPMNHVARFGLANVLEKRGQFDRAIEQHRKVIEIKPDFELAHANLADIYSRMGRFDEALPHYRKAVELQPAFASAHYNLGCLFANRGQIDQAIICLKTTIRLASEFAPAYNQLGILMADKRQFNDAIEQYRLALEIQPTYADARFNLGNALLAAGRNEEAIGEWEKTVKMTPSYAKAHYNLGHELYSRREVDAAIEHYRRALEIDPTFELARVNLNEVLRREGRDHRTVLR